MTDASSKMFAPLVPEVEAIQFTGLEEQVELIMGMLDDDRAVLDHTRRYSHDDDGVVMVDHFLGIDSVYKNVILNRNWWFVKEISYGETSFNAVSDFAFQKQYKPIHPEVTIVTSEKE